MSEKPAIGAFRGRLGIGRRMSEIAEIEVVSVLGKRLR
jgi:hypothetical protein